MAEKSAVIEKLSIFLAETLGTGLLVFLSCAGCISWGQPYNHLQTVLSTGLVILIVVQTFGCTSGAHINPAITVAATIFEILDVKVIKQISKLTKNRISIYFYAISNCRQHVYTSLRNFLVLSWDMDYLK